MTIDVFGLDCCCFAEIAGIEGEEYRDNPLRVLRDLRPELSRSGMIFTTTDPKVGDELAALIVKKKLGTVSYVGPILNRNTYNKVWLYVWKVNHDAWEEWRER